jgi:hypothetical protein
MDNVFQFRDQLIERYGSFSRSFVRIAAPDIQAEVEHQYAGPLPGLSRWCRSTRTTDVRAQCSNWWSRASWTLLAQTFPGRKN